MEEAEELQTPIAVLGWMSERGDLSLLQQRCELYQQQENVSFQFYRKVWTARTLAVHPTAQGRAVYRFVLEVDVCQLLQFNGWSTLLHTYSLSPPSLLPHSASLGNLLLHKPRHAWEAFQHVSPLILLGSSITYLLPLSPPFAGVFHSHHD